MAMKRLVFALVSVGSLHLASGHRGEEDGNKSIAFATLPRATFHFEGQRNAGGRQKFQHETPGSLLEESSGRLMVQDDKTSGMNAENASAVPPGASISIYFGDGLPMARFAGAEAAQDSHAATITIHPHAQANSAPSHKVTVGSSAPHLPEGFKLPKDFEDKFDRMSLSVVRIQAITAEVNWFEPYQQPQDMQLVGSGLAVKLEDVPEIVTDPIFITNAHVVRDAHDVQVQLPAIGQQFFPAFVALICDDFDLAVVQLIEPEKFMKALKNTKYQASQLDAFPIPEGMQWKLGDEVASVGFPLGSTSLKLSRGVVSGTEEVGDFICYQTTAPISPGSSGGPLFGLDDNNELHVVGATFASAAAHGAQNTNYVVPTVAITQVLQEYRQVRKQNEEQFRNLQAGRKDDSTEEDHDDTNEEDDTADGESDRSGEIKPDHHGNDSSNGVNQDHPDQSNIHAGSEKQGGQTPAIRHPSKKLDKNHGSTSSKELPTNAHRSGGENGGRPKKAPQVSSVGKEKLGASKTVHRVHHASHPLQLKSPGLGLIKKEIVIKHPHKQYKIAPVDAVGIEANQALYDWSCGDDGQCCRNGVFLSKILDTSVFKKATTKDGKPAEIPEKSFLTKVMGPRNVETGQHDYIKLDEFGMGRSPLWFLGDPMPFESMMMMKDRPGESVEVMVCHNGKEEEYKVNMRWDDNLYKQKVELIMEPHFAPEMLRYEVFAGVTVMQMTVNHIVKLLRIGQPPTLGRWLLPENQLEPKMIVTHVEKGTYASRVLSPGMVIDEINGEKISDFDDYEKYFEPKGDNHKEKVWTLTTDRGVLFATKFAQAIFEQIMKAEMGLTYLFCKTVVNAARDIKKLALMPDGVGDSLNAGSSPAVNNAAFRLADSNSTSAVSSWNSSIPPGVDCGRVTKVTKVEALARSASMFLQTGEQVAEDSKEEVRRRARVAHAGFHILPASELSTDEDLRRLLGNSNPM